MPEKLAPPSYNLQPFLHVRKKVTWTPPFIIHENKMPLSSRGLGHNPFTEKTKIQIYLRVCNIFYK